MRLMCISVRDQKSHKITSPINLLVHLCSLQRERRIGKGLERKGVPLFPKEFVHHTSEQVMDTLFNIASDLFVIGLLANGYVFQVYITGRGFGSSRNKLSSGKLFAFSLKPNPERGHFQAPILILNFSLTQLLYSL